MCESYSDKTSILQQFSEALTCAICQEVATLPVHGTCCDKAKALQPGCLSCVRTWYQQDKDSTRRDNSVKSFGGCGCNVLLNNNKKNYEDSLQLDMVRNLIGPSVCFHKNCGASFDTCEELRRHLEGKARKDDKYKNCEEVFIKCPYCSFLGKRHIVEGEHYNDNHKKEWCSICSTHIDRYVFKLHYIQHVSELKEEFKSLERKKSTILKKQEQLNCMYRIFENKDEQEGMTTAINNQNTNIDERPTSGMLYISRIDTLLNYRENNFVNNNMNNIINRANLVNNNQDNATNLANLVNQDNQTNLPNQTYQEYQDMDYEYLPERHIF